MRTLMAKEVTSNFMRQKIILVPWGFLRFQFLFDFYIPHDAQFLLPINSRSNYYFSMVPPRLYSHQHGHKALPVLAWKTMLKNHEATCCVTSTRLIFMYRTWTKSTFSIWQELEHHLLRGASRWLVSGELSLYISNNS